MAAVRARSLLQACSSSSTHLRSAVARSVASSRPTRPPLGIPNRRPPSAPSPLLRPNPRYPLELSFCVESLLPKHSASADALMNSLLSVSSWSYGFLLEGGYTRDS